LANNLSVTNVDAGYGSVRVLENVSLVINGGETVVLLGARARL
jgi:branched-chain amino acid transport system ATP-binding protein